MKKILLLSSLFISTVAMGDIKMLYSKGTPYALGKNYNMDQPFERKESCVSYKSFAWSQVDDGALNMSFNSNLITSSSDLTKNLKVGIDLSAKAKFKLVNAQFDMKSEIVKNFHSFEDSLTHLVQAEYDFGIKELVDVELKEEYQKLIQEGKHQEFIQKCGTHFVDASNQMVLINVMLKMSNLNSEKKQSIKASFGASGSYAGMGGSLKASLVKSFNIAQKFGSTSIKVEALGAKADHMSQFGSSNNLEKTLEAMAHLMKSVNRKSSMPGSFTFVSMERFGLKIPEYDFKKQHFINTAFHISMEYENKLIRLSEEIKKLKLSFNQGASGKKSLAYFMAIQRKMGKINEKLNGKVSRCIKDNHCEASELAMMNFEIDWPTDFIKNIEATSICYYQDNKLDGLSKFLSGRLTHFELVKRIDVFRTSQGQRTRLSLRLEDFTFNSDFSKINGVFDQINALEVDSIESMIRDSIYEVVLTDRYGLEQNYKINELTYGNCK